MRSYEEVDNLFLSEYRLLMKAYSLSDLDKEHAIYKQAYVTNVATATKEKGKKTVPMYPKFEDLFDFKRYEEELLGIKKKKTDKNKRLKELILKANKKGG